MWNHDIWRSWRTRSAWWKHSHDCDWPPNKNQRHQGLLSFPGWQHTLFVGEVSVVHVIPLGEDSWKLPVLGLSYIPPYVPLPVADFNLYSFTVLNLRVVLEISQITAYQRSWRCFLVLHFKSFIILPSIFWFVIPLELILVHGVWSTGQGIYIFSYDIHLTLHQILKKKNISNCTPNYFCFKSADHLCIFWLLVSVLQLSCFLKLIWLFVTLRHLNFFWYLSFLKWC